MFYPKKMTDNLPVKMGRSEGVPRRGLPFCGRRYPLGLALHPGLTSPLAELKSVDLKDEKGVKGEILHWR